MYTLYKQDTPIRDIATDEIIGWNTIPVMVADDFFIQFGLTFDWKNKTVSRNGETFYLDNVSDETTMKIPSPDEWLATYNNYIKTFYFAKGEDLDNNPSDNPKNIKRRIYYNSQNIKKYDIRYSWDKNDKILKEMSVAPNKEGAMNVRLTILNSDPTTTDSRLEIMFQEDTLVKISELKERLTKEISTYKLLGISKDGKTDIEDFVISENTTLIAKWEAITKTCKIVVYFGDDETSLEKTITQTIGSSVQFTTSEIFNELVGLDDANKWELMAYVPTKFTDGERVYTSEYSDFLFNDIELKLICEKRYFSIMVLDEESEVIGVSGNDFALGDSVNIPESFDLKAEATYKLSDESEIADGIFELTQDFLLPESAERNISENNVIYIYQVGGE